MAHLETLIGKPLVVYARGKRREVGRIENVTSTDKGRVVEISASVSDEAVAKLLREAAED